MATRKINSFIEHLMNESMTTSAAGGSTKAGKGAGKTSTMGGSYRSGDDPYYFNRPDGTPMQITPYPEGMPSPGVPHIPGVIEPEFPDSFNVPKQPARRNPIRDTFRQPPRPKKPLRKPFDQDDLEPPPGRRGG